MTCRIWIAVVITAVLACGCTSSPLAPVPEPAPEVLEWLQPTHGTAFTGLRTEENDSRSLDALFFAPGVRVVRVVENSPAAKAGIRSGDIVMSVGDREVNDPVEFEVLVEDAAGNSGGPVDLSIQRGDTVFSVPVDVEVLADTRGEARPLWVSDPSRTQAGWAVGETGVRLVSLAADSPLTDRLEIGEEVLAVDGEAVRTGRAMVRRLQSYPPGTKVTLRMADGRDERIRLLSQPTKLTSFVIPILVQYRSDTEGTETTFCILDFWLFAIYKFERVGEERTWTFIGLFETSTGVGHLAE
jgi:membrane-associated protease RseP (regulator of RpoE activity)